MDLLIANDNQIIFMEEKLTKKGNLKFTRRETLLMPVPFDVTDDDNQREFVCSVLRVDDEDISNLYAAVCPVINPDENTIGVVVFRPQDVKHYHKWYLKRRRDFLKHIKRSNTVEELLGE